MNLTLSVDERVVERARQVARQQGTSLNELIRRYLEQLGGQASGDAVLQAFEELWKSEPGRSDAGYRFDRDELYEERAERQKPR